MENNNMPLDFWSQVWQEGTIRFHQKDYNSQMISFFKDMDLKGKSVFIPLAGKTKDILFFLEKRSFVTAIEFVESAIIDFFKENNIHYTKKDSTYFAPNLTFHCMDYFKFEVSAPFDVLYDRASQVVFNSELRPAYYDHMKTLISPQTIVLLAAIDHSGPSDYGPPYKISPAEVTEAYKKMNIPLRIYSEATEVASEKMQTAGIQELNSYFLIKKDLM